MKPEVMQWARDIYGRPGHHEPTLDFALTIASEFDVRVVAEITERHGRSYLQVRLTYYGDTLTIYEGGIGPYTEAGEKLLEALWLLDQRPLGFWKLESEGRAA